jgi:hypothetical protein
VEHHSGSINSSSYVLPHSYNRSKRRQKIVVAYSESMPITALMRFSAFSYLNILTPARNPCMPRESGGDRRGSNTDWTRSITHTCAIRNTRALVRVFAAYVLSRFGIVEPSGFLLIVRSIPGCLLCWECITAEMHNSAGLVGRGRMVCRR